MAVPLIPGPLDQIGRRSFSFYPPIVGIEHNEWVLRRITWADVLVMNTKTSQDLWIPRRFVGEVSAIEEPFTIVGLINELEYAAGVVVPHQRRVIEMPRAVNGPRVLRRAPRPPRPAPVIGIRVEACTQSRAWRHVLAWFAAGILACIAAAFALIVLGGHKKSTRDHRAPGASEQIFHRF
ncbi:MAG TPA: hypothetical protein VFW83_09295 [Bryobacteraceae bacterium]|nr:hypothetical protein [Bryobacteraceae bacterium]